MQFYSFVILSALDELSTSADIKAPLLLYGQNSKLLSKKTLGSLKHLLTTSRVSLEKTSNIS